MKPSIWSWITYDYDALGRLTIKNMQPLSGSTWRYSYTYDDAGRLHRVTCNDQDPAPRAAEYDYDLETGRIHDIHFLEGEDTVVSTRKLWDGLGRQTDTYGYNTSMFVRARRSHEYNSANQITRTTDESNSYSDYGYDDLGQVTSGQKFLWAGIALDGHDLDYSYDDIGNRTTTVTNGRSANWTSNAVNQYTSREVPGAVDIFGMADRYDGVTVNGVLASRQVEHFYRLLDFPNTASARYEEVTVETEDPFGTPLESVTGYSFLPQTPEIFTYDADGNLLSDGRWNYTWDAENRLTRVETRMDLPSHMPRKRIDYQYDFMGRRFMMRTYEWGGTEWDFYLWERYLYDGWTLVGREGGSVNGQRTQHYMWGLDESGTLGGAGDVGGLLMIRDIPSGKTYHPTIDANGNVIALWDADTAEVAAYYDYDPFGKTVRATGPAAEVSPFRFSTKYQDFETGFYYYGYRYYQPETGRWLNRDPIEEEGGLNLHEFVGNNPVNWWDYLGFAAVPDHPPFNINDPSSWPDLPKIKHPSVDWPNSDPRQPSFRQRKPDPHLDRNRHNRCPKREPKRGRCSEKREWIKDGPNPFHKGTIYRHADGSKCSYDQNGDYIPGDATYNYAPPPYWRLSSFWDHIVEDVWPHIYGRLRGISYAPDRTEIYE